MPKPYLTINIPIQWKPYIDKLLRDPEVKRTLQMNHCSPTASGLGKWIILKYLMKNTDYRFEHFNLDENGVKIQDKRMGIITQIYFKPDKAFCEYDESQNCEHVKFALSIAAVQEILRKKGWKYKESGLC